MSTKGTKPAKPVAAPPLDPYALALDLTSDTEYEIRVVAVPKTRLDMKVSGTPAWKEATDPGETFPSLKLEVDFEGPGENLPDVLWCSVHGEIASKIHGLPLASSSFTGSFELKKNGGTYRLKAIIDAIDSALVGEGKIAFSLKPDFPHAVPSPAGEVAFNNPVEIDLRGTTFAKIGDTNPAPAYAKIGQRISVKPTVASCFTHLRGFHLQARLVEWKASKKEADDSLVETLGFDKTLEERPWYVGTTHVVDLDEKSTYRHLNCHKPSEKGDYELDMVVEISRDEGVHYVPLWSLRRLGRYIPVKRPSLKSFAQDFQATDGGPFAAEQRLSPKACWVRPEFARVGGQIENLVAKDLGWTVLVTFWGARPDESVDAITVSAKNTVVTRSSKAVHTTSGSTGSTASAGSEGRAASVPPLVYVEPILTVPVPLSDTGVFFATLAPSTLPFYLWGSVASYGTFFATFSIDPQVTNTQEPVPLSQVMDIDTKKFRPVNVDDLFAHDEKRDHLCTQVATENVPPNVRRLPHIAGIVPVMRVETLTLEFHLTGESAYWNKAKVNFGYLLRGAMTPAVAGDPSTATALDVVAPKDRPQVRVGQLSLAGTKKVPAVAGQTVTIFASKAAPNPQHLSLDVDCTPRLVHVQRYERDDKSWRLVCNTHCFPNHVDDKNTTKHVARFCFYEEMRDTAGAAQFVPLGQGRIEYDIPFGGGGRVSRFEQLAATVRDPEPIRKAPGRIWLRAELPPPGDSVFGVPVPPSAILIHDVSPRRCSIILPFGRCVSAAFKWEVLKISGELAGLVTAGHAREEVAKYLMIVMALETGASFLPDVECEVAPHALGLVQFIVTGDTFIGTIAGQKRLDELKRAHGTEGARVKAYRDELGAMTQVEQLTAVKNYLVPLVKTYQPKTIDDYYLCVFYPAANKWQRGQVVGNLSSPPGSTSYKIAASNPGHCKDGKVTRESISANVHVWETKGKDWQADINDNTVIPHPDAGKVRRKK